MKTVVSFFFVALLSVSSAFAQADDASVASWRPNIGQWSWVSNIGLPAVGVDNVIRNVVEAKMVTDFIAADADFDAVWATAGAENLIANNTGLVASDGGAEDFEGKFKVLYDEQNIYVMLQFVDEDITGTESIEIPLAPYFKVDATDIDAYPAAWYTRLAQFGGNKLVFNKDGFINSMMLTFDASGVEAMNWGGTTPTLSSNLYLDDKTASAITSGSVKWIITIGFDVLTGEFRPTFDIPTWTALNAGNGISFDMKVNDVDGDDAMKADLSGTAPAEYWWNATNNDCWLSTMYAGFISTHAAPYAPYPYEAVTAVKQVQAANTIFGKVVANQIQLNEVANVTVYNAAGMQVLSVKNTNSVNLSGLSNGVYVVRANNQTQKFVR